MNVHTASDPLRAPSLGLGIMGMSELYGPADDAESVTTIQTALDHGVRLFETGDAYGMGHGELLLRDALRGRRRQSALISIRFGALREPGGGWTGSDSRPVAVKNALAYSLRRLGTDYIDIYRPGRPDPDVPIRRRSAPSVNWSRPDTSGASAFPRSARPRYAGPTRPILSPTCRSNTRSSPAA